MKFTEWLDREWSKEPPLDAQLAVNFLVDYLLGEDWFSTMPMSAKQVYIEIVDAILEKYSRKYRKEKVARRKANSKK